MEALFQKRLNYTVEVHTNLTAEAIYNLLQQKRATNHSSFDSFVCCIMTHGCNGRLYGCDGRYVTIKELTDMFKARICKSLAGKPKFFVFEACQVSNIPEDNEMETDGSVGSTEAQLTPNGADFILGYATVPYDVAYRHPKKGSWYINVLVDTIKKTYQEHDLLRLLSMVNDRMSELSNRGDKQTSSVFTTLRKCFYLYDVLGAKASDPKKKLFQSC